MLSSALRNSVDGLSAEITESVVEVRVCEVTTLMKEELVSVQADVEVTLFA